VKQAGKVPINTSVIAFPSIVNKGGGDYRFSIWKAGKSLSSQSTSPPPQTTCKKQTLTDLPVPFRNQSLNNNHP